jgi:tetratricopeptide (TPR) repeat protein
MFRDALAAPVGTRDAVLHASLASAAAHLEYRLDRYAEAQAGATRALELARTTRDPDAILQCYKVLGASSYRLGHLEDARRYYGLALKQSPAETDPRNAAAMLDNLALVEKASGKFDEALRLSLESLVQHRRLGDAAGVALCLNNLGSLYIARREPEAALPLLEEGQALCDHHGFASVRLLVGSNLMDAALLMGDREAARRHGTRALQEALAANNRAVAAYLRLTFASIAIDAADLEAARAELAGGLEIAIAVGRPQLLLMGVGAFARLLEAQGERACAHRVMAFAAAHPATDVAERKDLRARLAAWDGHTGGDWPGLGLDELVHRVVAEAGLAHAPLIEALR